MFKDNFIMALLLKTNRLHITELSLANLDAIMAYNQQAEFYQWLETKPTLESTIAYLTQAVERNEQTPRRFWYLGIFEETTNKLIGDIVLWANSKYPNNIASIGYSINPLFWGQGLATEALIATTNYAHDKLKFHRIQTGAFANNIGSWRVLEKAGYIRESIQAFAAKSAQGTWAAQNFEYASVKPALAI